MDEQALHVDTNVQRKRSKDQDISNHKYTCWDAQALHVDTNVAIAYSVDTLTYGGMEDVDPAGVRASMLVF
jgi:hypothetical protein